MIYETFINTNCLGILQETLMITSFVIIMMLFIELLNVSTRESFVKLLNKNSFIQVLTGTIFGLLPGCMGTFVVVALYSKKIISLGALIATMIATVGDEAFFMIAVMPQDTLKICGILAIIAISVGLLCDKFFKNKFQNSFSDIIHDHEHCSGHTHKKHDCIEVHKNTFSYKNIAFSKYKIFLSLIIFAIIVLTAVNFIGHSHDNFFGNHKHEHNEVKIPNNTDCKNHYEEHEHDNCSKCDCNNSNHEHEHGNEELIIKIVLIVAATVLLLLLLLCNEHFIKEHLWKHVFLKHFLKIFLWIFGTLIFTTFILKFTDLTYWLNNNYFIVLLFAVLIGIIPQSGPHLIFIILFVNNSIPFSILLANSLVQDGHGGLPLIAENKKTFLFKKIISIIIALAIGVFGYIFKI